MLTRTYSSSISMKENNSYVQCVYASLSKHESYMFLLVIAWLKEL